MAMPGEGAEANGDDEAKQNRDVNGYGAAKHAWDANAGGKAKHAGDANGNQGPSGDRVDKPEQRWRPTREQLAEAAGKTVPDIIRPGLKVVFCGINPGLYSGAVGHHFARPGNRFWPALHQSGFTGRLLSPFEERALLDYGIGVINLVDRASAAAVELTDEEFRQGAGRVARKVATYRPRFVAFLGVGAYRLAFGKPKARTGEQRDRIRGSRVWLLANPSGLNANYQIADFAREFRSLRMALDAAEG